MTDSPRSGDSLAEGLAANTLSLPPDSDGGDKRPADAVRVQHHAEWRERASRLLPARLRRQHLIVVVSLAVTLSAVGLQCATGRTGEALAYRRCGREPPPAPNPHRLPPHSYHPPLRPSPRLRLRLNPYPHPPPGRRQGGPRPTLPPPPVHRHEPCRHRRHRPSPAPARPRSAAPCKKSSCARASSGRGRSSWIRSSTRPVR